MWYCWPTKSVKLNFQPGPLSEILTIANLWHAASLRHGVAYWESWHSQNSLFSHILAYSGAFSNTKPVVWDIKACWGIWVYTIFWMENSNSNMDIIRAFFLFGTFVSIFKKWVPVSLAEVNMHQYPWICMNILENAWINCSDYAGTLNMHYHLTF